MINLLQIPFTIPRYLVPRLATEHMTISFLSEDGRDEFFVGYNCYILC